MNLVLYFLFNGFDYSIRIEMNKDYEIQIFDDLQATTQWKNVRLYQIILDY